jgi:hypothetical protein
MDDVNGGACNGVTIGETPGVWWRIQGTGDKLRASTCHEKTAIKVKITVFSTNVFGDCNKLKCEGVSTEADFECGISIGGDGNDSKWNTKSTRIYFDTEPGVWYYLLVQQESATESGVVWLNFERIYVPQNNDCVDAIGPVPRDGTIIQGSSELASISSAGTAGYCNYQDALYPGIWFQVFGNGGDVVLNACGQDSLDGYYFSVYEAATCGNLECAKNGKTETTNNAPECFFITGEAIDDATNGLVATGVQRDSFQYTFPSNDGYRYYVYLHHARTEHNLVTSQQQRFWVTDGADVTPSPNYGFPNIVYRDSAYGMGSYYPGSNNRGSVDVGSSMTSTIDGGSGDLSTNQLNRAAVLSSFVSFAFLFMEA